MSLVLPPEMSPNQLEAEALKPSSEVLKGFNIEPSTALAKLSGGRGTVYRAGNIVLKRLDMSLEMLEWLMNTFGTIARTPPDHSKKKDVSSPTIRLSTPIFGRLKDGSTTLVVKGWTAWNWLDGVNSGSLGPLLEDTMNIKESSNQDTQGIPMEYDPNIRYKWDHIITAGERFSALMREHGVTKPAFLESRKDPWGLADRVAWSELSLEREATIDIHVDNKTYGGVLGPHWRTEAKYLGETLDILRDLDHINSTQEPSQIIHGDLTGNVVFALPFASSAPLGIIDISPYFRPPSFSTAIVLVDALACEDAPEKWAISYLKTKQDIKMFVRALIFRIVSDYLLGVTGVGAGDDYTRPVEVLREIMKE